MPQEQLPQQGRQEQTDPFDAQDLKQLDDFLARLDIDIVKERSELDALD